MENLNIENIKNENPIEENILEEKPKKKRGPKKPSKYPLGAFKDPSSPWYRSGCGKGNGIRKNPKKEPEPKITITLKEYNDLIVFKDRYNQMVNLISKEN